MLLSFGGNTTVSLPVFILCLARGYSGSTGVVESNTDSSYLIKYKVLCIRTGT